MSDTPTYMPKPSYGCHREGCSLEHTYPADHLWWWDGKTYPAEHREEFICPVLEPGWYCCDCIDDLGAETSGVNLETFMKESMGGWRPVYIPNRGSPQWTAPHVSLKEGET